MAEDLQQVYAQAIAAHESGAVEKAVALYGRIIDQFPDADLVLYNQGLALYELGRFGEAVTEFSKAAQIRQDDADTWFNLGLALKQDQQYPEAQAAYQRALQLQPQDSDVLFNLANCCREAGEPEQAALYYEQLLALEPENVSGLNNFAYLCHLQHEYVQAEALYRRLLKLCSDHPGALHMLAALNGTAEVTPANEYVRDLFDQYSDSFEKSLVQKLEYHVPELLFKLLQECDSTEKKSGYTNCVDLGCGTGLAGVLFKPLCSQLTGVDLSGNMVAVAAEKQVYDRLATDDVVRFMQNEQQQADLFIAADLLTYMADLEPLFLAVAQKSSPGGLFIFSTEHGKDQNWQVRPTGRFAHHPDYIGDIAQKSGWRIVCSEKANLRKEGDAWVVGDIFILRF